MLTSQRHFLASPVRALSQSSRIFQGPAVWPLDGVARGNSPLTGGWGTAPNAYFPLTRRLRQRVRGKYQHTYALRKNMLTPTLLITIRGPLKTIDLELPGDVPVSELIPLFLEICGSQRNDPQESLQTPARLQVAGRSASLPLNKTLIDAGVCDGAVLVLQTHRLPSIRAENLASQQSVPKTVRLDANAGGIGVTWESLK